MLHAAACQKIISNSFKFYKVFIELDNLYGRCMYFNVRMISVRYQFLSFSMPNFTQELFWLTLVNFIFVKWGTHH